MADDITRDDMERAAARIAARDGLTVDEVRDRVRKVVERDCIGCGERFAATRADKAYCTTACRARTHRANGSGGAA